MQSLDKTREQLLEELKALRQGISELEASESRLLGTEKALRESEERFRLLYENAPLGYQSLDENGCFLEVNQAWLDTLGYSREEVVGKWFGDFLAPGYQDHFKINFPKFKAAGEIHWVEFEMLRRDGSQISVAFDGQIGHDEKGRFRQTHCILHDISEIKRSQDALKESEQRYRAVVDNLEVGISLINPDMEIVEVNKAFTRYFPNVRPACGQICYEQYNDPPRSEPCWYCPCVLTLQDGEVHEAITETPAGSEIRYYHLVSSPIKDSEGRVQYVIELTEDITERKKAQESIDRANQEWERTFNAISDLVMVLDDKHKILRANKAMADALGMTERELIGKSCFELVHGEKEPPAFCPHSKLLTDGAEHSAEVVEPRLGGIYDVRVSPLVGQNGQVIGSVHVTRDITERKRVEEALQDSEERLRLTLEATQIGIWDWNVKTDQWYASPIYYTMLGYEPKTGLADRREWLERLHPDDRAYVNEKIQDVLTRDFKEYQYEARLRHADGTYRWQHVQGVGIKRAEDGKVTRMLGIRMDITERKRAENIMLARLRLVEHATSHSLDELLQATLDEVEALTDSSIGFYHFVEADQKTLRLQAWSTRTLREMCTAEGKGLHYDISEAGVWVDCVHQRKPVIHNDYSALPHRKGMPAGHATVIRELVVPVFRGDRLVAVLGVGNKPAAYGASDIETVSLLADLAWDIAERKLAEEALRAASLYNRSLIEASLDPLVTISADGKITDVNEATERVTGYSRDELIGTDFADYFTDPQKARDGYEQAFKEGAVKDYELEIRHRRRRFDSCDVQRFRVLRPFWRNCRTFCSRKGYQPPQAGGGKEFVAGNDC